MLPQEIEAARTESTEDLEQQWLQVLACNNDEEPVLHPLNQRALNLIPVIFNEATRDFPSFMNIIYDNLIPEGEWEWEGEYLTQAMIKIYAVMNRIWERQKKKND